MNGRGHWLAQLAVLSSLAFPSVALAQAPATSFDELTRWVRIGDRVTVTDVTGHKVTGNIAGLKPETLALAVGEALRDFAQADTATITRREPDTLSNGALIGASVGAGLFLLALASSGGCDGCGGFVVLAAAFYGGAGAGIGVGIDALVPGRRTVMYQRPVGHARVGFSPRLSPARQGMVLSIGF